MRLAVVTATINAERAIPCMNSWRDHATGRIAYYVVNQGATMGVPWQRRDESAQGILEVLDTPQILGVVPAFSRGVQQALAGGAEIIACFHDDLEIQQDGWDETVVKLFKACPKAGLCGFGGARGLGDDDLYQVPYSPMQLARKTFGSNMRDAEVHGMRWESAQPVACLDGFSQIGLRNFWLGQEHLILHDGETGTISSWDPPTNLFERMQDLGVVHHMYDGMLGCYAKRLGYQTWFLPVRCHHHGGLTAVADPRYHEWANRFRDNLNRADTKDDRYEGTGDQMFWEAAHRIAYQEFRDVLPLRT